MANPFSQHTLRVPALLSAAFTLALFYACKTTQQNRPAHVPNDFDWQGHRGCRGLLPENSIPAFLRACTYADVTTLELDLAVSKDNQLIVSHEPWFNPAITTKPDGDSIRVAEAEQYLLYGMDAAAIRTFDCGSKGNPRFPQQEKQKTWKPTLQAVVEAVRRAYPGRTMRWNIEIKSEPAWDGIRTPPVAEFVRLAVAELKRLNLEQHCNLQSFDIRALEEIHRQAPDIRVAYLIENQDPLEANLAKLSFRPDIYSPYYQLVTRRLVRTCHHQGIKVIPWTVNDVPSMRHLVRLGVDGIITDYPNLIAAVPRKP